MCRTIEERKARVGSVILALLACAMCLGSAGCQHELLATWDRSVGTPLGTNGEPLSEKGQLWLEGLYGTPHLDVRLSEDGQLAWTVDRTDSCERLILQTLGRYDKWRAVMTISGRTGWPVTAYLVSIRPAVVVVVPQRCDGRLNVVTERCDDGTKGAPLHGLIGNFTYADSRVPGCEFAAVYLLDCGIGPIPLARGQSLAFPTFDGGVSLSAQSDGWVATWMKSVALSKESQRLLELYEWWKRPTGQSP